MARGVASYDKLIERLYRILLNDDTLEFRDILKILYIDKEMSVRGIARELGVSHSVVYKWLVEYGLINKKLKWH